MRKLLGAASLALAAALASGAALAGERPQNQVLMFILFSLHLVLLSTAK